MQHRSLQYIFIWHNIRYVVYEGFRTNCCRKSPLRFPGLVIENIHLEESQLLNSKPMKQVLASDSWSAFIYLFILVAKECRLSTVIEMGITDS